MSFTHFLNGEFVTETNLKISPRDLGFTRGYAVFDFFRTYNLYPLHLEMHLDRLLKSASLIHLNSPWSYKQIEEWVFELIQKNSDNGDIAIRVIISGGIPKNAIFIENPSLIMIVDGAIDFSDHLYSNGIMVKTKEYKKYKPEAKTTHYIESVIELNQNNNFEEVLYFADNVLREGAFSNVFVVTDKNILTPKSNILLGITRQLIINKIETYLEIVEADITSSELLNAKEVFLSVTGKGIVPVVQINDVLINNGKVGSHTRKIIDEYGKFILNAKNNANL